MFPGCYNADGRLRLKNAAPVGAFYNHGIACGNDFVYAFNAVAQGYVNGLSIADVDGSLAVNPSAAVTHYQNGFPFSTDVITVENAPAAYFQNGIPFTAAGKIAVEIVP